MSLEVEEYEIVEYYDKDENYIENCDINCEYFSDENDENDEMVEYEKKYNRIVELYYEKYKS